LSLEAGRTDGIFVFGGKNRDGTYCENMKVVRVGAVLKVEELPTKGRSPRPRIGHSMHYYQKISKIIIYGGKND